MLRKIPPNLIYCFLIILATAISIIPDIYRLYITPAGYSFPLIHNHPNDYFSYLSYMYTGFSGKWLVTTRVTSEHFAPQFVYTFYVLLGHLSKISYISPPWMYFIARIVFGVLILVSIVSVIKRIFKEERYRILACLFVFFGTGFWTVNSQNGKITINQFLTFWSHFDPIMRTTFLPHHLVSVLFGILALIFLIKALRKKSFKTAFFAGLLGFLAGINYHGTLTNILGGIGVGLFLSIPRFHKNKHFILKYSSLLAVFVAVSSFSLLYLLYLTTTVWPWTWSQSAGTYFSFFVSFKEYLLVLGPVLILTVLGLPLLFKFDNLLSLLLLGWAIFPFLGLFMLINIFPKFSNMIYLEATSYIPLGILAVYGVQQLEKWVKHRLIVAVFSVALLIYFIPPTVSSVYKQSVKFSPYYYNQYIPDDIISGYKWLENFTPYGSVILSGGYMGAIIPAYTHNYLVYGDRVTTYNSDEKAKDMNTFFRQNDIEAARKIIEKYDISYIFYSLDTDPPQPYFVSHIPLQQVFQNSKVTIYKVMK